MHRPIIHVLSYAQISSNELHQLMPFYHIDRDDCALAMPRHFVDYPENTRIKRYEDRIRNLIQDKDSTILVALDNIYNQSINGGVIIATLAQCVPFWTHAHIVRDLILELAHEEGPST